MTTGSFNFCAASSSEAPPARASSILSWMSCTLLLGALQCEVVADLRRHVGEGLDLLGFDLADTVTMTAPNRPCTGALTSPSLSEKAASATAGSMIVDFGTVPRSMSCSFSPRSAASAANVVPLLMRVAGGLRLRHGRKHDLLDVAPLRRDVAAAVAVESLLHVVVGDLDGLGELGRRHRRRSRSCGIPARGTGFCGRRNIC